MLGKQAKLLSRSQTAALHAFLKSTRHPLRNRAISLLSLQAGLRAHEIAHLRWQMVTDAEGVIGQEIQLEDGACKIWSCYSDEQGLQRSIMEWRAAKSPASKFVVSTERSRRTSRQAVVNMFARWYEQLGFVRCSSHSGRRTFITNAARKISLVGGSLRDVQMLAGHSSLRITQRYIDGEQEAKRKIVDLI